MAANTIPLPPRDYPPPTHTHTRRHVMPPALSKQSGCWDTLPVTLPCHEPTDRGMMPSPGSRTPQRHCRQGGGGGHLPPPSYGLRRLGWRPVLTAAPPGRRDCEWQRLGFAFRPESPGADDVRCNLACYHGLSKSVSKPF
jgi:hypothetical protein